MKKVEFKVGDIVRPWKGDNKETKMVITSLLYNNTLIEYKYMDGDNYTYSGHPKDFRYVDEKKHKESLSDPKELFGYKVMELTYKKIVDKYFGIELKEGPNAPKLSKQLSKKGITATNSELIYFGELAEFFKSIETLYVDTTDMELESLYKGKDKQGYDMDDWAFNGSCNATTGCGRNTPEYLDRYVIGARYLRGYVNHYDGMKPYYRAYFIENGCDLGHAGGYSDNGNCTNYEVTCLILNYATGNNFKVSDWVRDQGLDMVNEENGVWCNMGESTDYKKLSTKEDFLYYLGSFGDFEPSGVYCENTEDYCDEDEALWSDYHSCYIDPSGYYIYCEKSEDYYLHEEALWNDLGVYAYN